MNEFTEKLHTYDWGGDRGALMSIDERIIAACGNAEKLAEIEQALAEALQSETPLPAREYICRKLALMGTARCVPALATMLLDPTLSDCARLALEAIPDTAANDALLAALDKAEGNQRAGIVNSLDERKKHGLAAMETNNAAENK